MALVSIVTAFLNEEDNLPELQRRIEAVMSELTHDFELVLVDDHSQDGSSKWAQELAETNDSVQYLRLSRNCGSHAAFTAGLNIARGDCAVLLAADLQDPPEAIPDLLAEWENENDVVWAVREQREGESWTNKLFAGTYYWVMRRIALHEMPSRGADFLLMDRKVLDAFNAIPEKNTNFLAMILWIGFRQTSIAYTKKAREHGQSKWTLMQKVKLFVDSLVSFSYAPIRWMASLGILMAGCGFVYAAVVVIGRLTGFVVANEGFAAIMTVLLIGQGMILTMLGMLGEYIWRAFDEARGRPRYIIEKQIGTTESQQGQIQDNTDSHVTNQQDETQREGSAL